MGQNMKNAKYKMQRCKMQKHARCKMQDAKTFQIHQFELHQKDLTFKEKQCQFELDQNDDLPPKKWIRNTKTEIPMCLSLEIFWFSGNWTVMSTGSVVSKL